MSTRYKDRDCGECAHFTYMHNGKDDIEAVCLIRKGKGPNGRMILECECQQPACSRFLLCNESREAEGLPSIAQARAKRKADLEAAKQRKQEELAKLPPMFPQFDTKGEQS